MRKKIWVHKAHSFKEAEEFDLRYYFSMSSAERIEEMQHLREIYYKFSKGGGHGKGRKGLRRVVSIIK